MVTFKQAVQNNDYWVFVILFVFTLTCTYGIQQDTNWQLQEYVSKVLIFD